MAFDLSIVGKPLEPFSHAYGWKDAALYALACGATADELDLLLQTRGPRVLPSFSVVWTTEAIFDALGRLGGNLLTLVHGGHRLEIERALPPEAHVQTQVTVTQVVDKSKGVLAHLQARSFDEAGPIAMNEWRIFFRGEKSGSDARESVVPFESESAPADTVDRETEEATRPEQALLYRLASNDLNPIHADPEVARAVGFERPILHGLCTLGFAVRALVQQAAAGNPDRVRRVVARFTNPVLPGDTLRTVLRSSGHDLWFETQVRRPPDPEPLPKPAISQGRALRTD